MDGRNGGTGGERGTVAMCATILGKRISLTRIECIWSRRTFGGTGGWKVHCGRWSILYTVPVLGGARLGVTQGRRTVGVGTSTSRTRTGPENGATVSVWGWPKNDNIIASPTQTTGATPHFVQSTKYKVQYV